MTGTSSFLPYFMSSPVFALSATLPSLRVVGRVNEQFALTLLLSVIPFYTTTETHIPVYAVVSNFCFYK